jgi:hypothetical protein
LAASRGVSEPPGVGGFIKGFDDDARRQGTMGMTAETVSDNDERGGSARIEPGDGGGILLLGARTDRRRVSDVQLGHAICACSPAVSHNGSAPSFACDVKWRCCR